MAYRKCPPGCTCGKHSAFTPERRRAIGQQVAAAARRRRTPLPRFAISDADAERRYNGFTLALGAQAHRRCNSCGRLLAPADGKLPPHRVPATTPGCKTPPLTGKDSPWCSGTRFS